MKKIMMILPLLLIAQSFGYAGVTVVGDEGSVQSNNSDYHSGYQSGYRSNRGNNYSRGFLDGQEAKKRNRETPLDKWLRENR